MAKTKFYAVAQGTNPGIYRDWDSCKAQVEGVKNARYKSFATMDLAQAFISQHKEGTSSKSSKLGVVKGGVVKTKSVRKVTGTAITLSQRAKNALSKQSDTTAALGDSNTIEIFTDGSSRGNGKTGAVAGFGVYFGPEDSRNIAGRLAGPRQTNQRAELTAIIRALESVDSASKVVIKTDSQYSIDCFTKWHQAWVRNGWKNSQQKDVENKDLIQRGLDLLGSRQGSTQLIKVKAHIGIQGNEMADRLANEGALKPE